MNGYIVTSCVTLAVLGLLAALLDRTEEPTDMGGWSPESPEFRALLLRHHAADATQGDR